MYWTEPDPMACGMETTLCMPVVISPGFPRTPPTPMLPTGFPPVGSIGAGGVRGKPGEITTGIQSVVSIPQAIGSGSVQYIVEMDRLDQTQFRFSAWSTSNVLL